jgi:fibronectin type 3 domain-containing protein
MGITFGKSITLGLALLGLLLGGNARAQIALQDGSTNLVTTATSPISINKFTVTSGASVLIVSLFDRNNVNGNLSPASLSWGSQTLTRIVSVNNAASTYADSDIYYLWSPTPGTAAITATDTSGGTVSAMTMQAYTLSGVDTNVAPVIYTNSYNGVASIAVTLSGSTPVVGWAVVNSSYGTGNQTMYVTSSGGTVNCAEVQNNTSQVMGYIANIGSGGSTITANAGNGAGTQKMALGVAVFAPYYSGPVAPTNLVATAHTNQVALSWNDASGGAATSYTVLRSSSGIGFTAIATNLGNGSTTYTDNSVTPLTPYSYVVNAIGSGGAGPYSSVASATPFGIPPATPTNLVATAQTNQVRLSWADASGGLATSYTVLRSITSGSGYLPIATLTGNGSTTYTDIYVYDGITYYYVVEASDVGGPSVPSSQAGATPFFTLPTGQSGVIARLDGGTSAITTVANGAGSTIRSSFTVSQGASVMVVELWDRNTFNNNSSPAFMTWSNAATGTTQALIRAVSEVSGASTYSDCDIYYLFNPTPGSGTISGTDTNPVTIQGMTMMPFTLKGVDTTVAPVIYATNGASATTLSVTTSARTPAGAWAAVISYDGNSGQAITQTSTSGASTTQNVNNNQEQSLGYVSSLAAGSSTITMTAGGGATKCTLAVAVFMPAIGTGIALHDGSIFPVATAGAGVATISQPFGVSQGAGVMVVALFDNDNSGPQGYPGMNLMWSNTTFGTTQPLSIGIATNSGQYTWIWTTLYYLMDPLPGNGVVIGTDTNGTYNNMSMQAYTLSGVDTTVSPVGYGLGMDNTTLSVDTSPSTLIGSAAAVISVNYNGGTGNHITFTATSGTVLTTNVWPGGGGVQGAAGYINNLSAGDTTITATSTGAASHMNIAAEVFSPLIVLTAPTSVSATAQTNQIKLSWADSSGGQATGYIVLRSTTSGSGYTAIATNTGNASTTYTDTAVIDWTPYYYVVEAVGPGGVSVPSAGGSATAVGLPAGVTGLTATADINQVDLSWNNQFGANSFNVLRSTTSGSGFSLIGTSTTNSYTDPAVNDGTLYYYEVSAVNGSGESAKSSQVSAIPVVAFFTNWVGVFNTDADTNGWTIINGAPLMYLYPDAPPSGPSSQCLIMDAVFDPNSFYGIGRVLSPSLNVSTYKTIEMDIKNQTGWDEWGQVQGIQMNLQVPVGGNPTYERGTWGDIVLYQAQTGGAWTHYTAPLTNWGAYNLASVTSVGLNLYDGNCIVPTEMYISYANVAFCGAPAWASAFSVANKTAPSGSTSVTLTGQVKGTVAGAPVYLASNTVVNVTINGSTQTTVIKDSTGDFGINFDTTGFADGAYPIAYTAPNDMVALIGATNSSTTLTLSGTAIPPSPTILAPTVDATGANMAVRVATASGHTYYLLSATNLAPPIVWKTNSTTAGTGGTITNLVPINHSQQDLFLKYMVQ